ncbi:SdpI family protein [Saccharopolyspora hirsuta]|uniref:SdpI family protein n=1 Tax=Saccharopolyspora hirsuta TaxID=1837 RepID=A0A5M7C2N8_SACHI|nr:SdpI family protein [Saccharopolyspora hirsuta]KAA5836242.1 SdpI family protein [Saccharopolyspora hirsuta]
MLAVQVILCAILVLGGAALLLLGFRGLRGQLPRNRYVGVRTPAAMSSDEAFELANRAAAPAMLAGGAAAVLAGVSVPMLASTFSVVMISVLGLVGAFALMTAGGVVGNRAAEAMPAPAPAAGGCSGCACGGCSALPRD